MAICLFVGPASASASTGPWSAMEISCEMPHTLTLSGKFRNGMNNMRIKPGASVKGIQPEMAVALIVIDSAYSQIGVEAVLTSGTDGAHGVHSLHPDGKAVDIRTNNVHAAALPDLVCNVKGMLGPEFDAVLESDHLHVEFDPKKPQGEQVA